VFVVTAETLGLLTDDVYVIVHVYTAIAELLSSIELGKRLIRAGDENQSVTGML